MNLQIGQSVFHAAWEKWGIVSSNVGGDGLVMANFGQGPKPVHVGRLSLKVTKTAGLQETSRVSEARERNAIWEKNEAFRGNRYNPKTSPASAEALKKLLTNNCKIIISCQKSAIPALAEGLKDLLLFSEQYIVPATEKTHDAKFDIVADNTQELKTLCDDLQIYANPRGKYARPSYNKAQISSRTLSEELIRLGVVPEKRKV